LRSSASREEGESEEFDGEASAAEDGPDEVPNEEFVFGNAQGCDKEQFSVRELCEGKSRFGKN